MSGCYSVKYCGSKCQRADWNVHKRLCKARQKEYVVVRRRSENILMNFVISKMHDVIL